MNAQPAMRGSHRVYDFSGTAYEIGVQHGRALRAGIELELARASASLCNQAGGKASAESVIDRVFDAYEPLFRQLIPESLDELRGVAQGSGLTYRQAFVACAGDGARVPRAAVSGTSSAALSATSRGGEHACTALACGKSTTASGHVLMGQNKDAGDSTDRYHVIRYAYASGRRMVLLNYPGWIANIGLTGDGMCLAGNSRYAASPDRDTVPFSILKRLVLEKSSVAQVLDNVRGLYFENGAFLIGDATGRLAWIECVAGNVRVTDISDRAFGQANSVLCDDLKKHEDAVLATPSSPTRQRNVQKRLDENRGKPTLEHLQRILADHEDYPMSICRHSCDADVLHTTAAFVADLNDLEIRISIGNPCAAEFKSYRMPE